jgi:hypothetical protein
MRMVLSMLKYPDRLIIAATQIPFHLENNLQPSLLKHGPRVFSVALSASLCQKCMKYKYCNYVICFLSPFNLKLKACRLQEYFFRCVKVKVIIAPVRMFFDIHQYN